MDEKESFLTSTSGHHVPEGDGPVDDHAPHVHLRRVAEASVQHARERRLPTVPPVAHLPAAGAAIRGAGKSGSRPGPSG